MWTFQIFSTSPDTLLLLKKIQILLNTYKYELNSIND